MRRFQFTIRQLLIRAVPIVAVIAMIGRAATSWGPLNLIVFVGCVVVSAAVLACVPFIPHRPFWAGLASFGVLYAVLLWLLVTLANVGLKSSMTPRQGVAHALTDLFVGTLGGGALLLLAKWRESRRWDREALPERPLEEFMLPPLKIDRPLNSK